MKSVDTEGIAFKKVQELIGTILLWNGTAIDAFQKVTEESNKRGFGDHAVFRIVHA